MYVFLLILGAVVSAAGFALVASGVSIQEHAFDTSILTPGMIAIIGGFVLIGFSFAIRMLQRIEWTLTERLVTRSPRPAEAPVETAAVPEPPREPVRIPFPAKPKIVPNPQPAAVAAAPPPAEDAAVEPVRERFPNVVRLDTAPAVEDADVPPLLIPAARSSEAAIEVNGVAAARVNGAGPPRAVLRPEAMARPPNPVGQKPSMFDSLWPKAQQRVREMQAAAPALHAGLPPEPHHNGEALPGIPPAIHHKSPPTPISILKSGVVDGMAYTLYSDGSIEAQLPQGMLRFGSITELRNHIEQAS